MSTVWTTRAKGGTMSGRSSQDSRPTGRAGRAIGRLGFLAALVVVVFIAGIGTQSATVSTAGASGSDWTVYHGDLLGSGVASGSSVFQGATQSWTSHAVHGELFGEPLVEGDSVVVATEADMVYALNAANGATVWSTRVGTPVPARALPCGDIKPTVGITSTPVIDPARSEVFVVADEKRKKEISHHLVGLSLATGAILLDQIVDPPGTTPSAQLQRAALTLDDGQVIMASGGNAGDCSTYNGWVVAVPEGGGPLSSFEVDPTPGNLEGAIWMGGAAPIVDSSGNIWVASGNGSNTSGSSPDYSDSVIELSSALTPLQSFTPSTWATDNASDFDLGSSSPALLPDGLVVQVGKSQTAYLLSQATLGGVGGQLAELDGVCGNDVDGGDAFVGQVVYIPCLNGVIALQATASPPSLAQLWMTSTNSPGPPIVADGLVWTIDRTATKHGGVLYGLDPQTGSSVVQFPLGALANHFPTPSVGDGLLLAASSTKVHAFALTP
jgi:outer membrane protein assembly factor BamB